MAKKTLNSSLVCMAWSFGVHNRAMDSGSGFCIANEAQD